MNLVVIGNGMAGARAVEEILARGGGGMFRVTMFGAEPCGNYNRILLPSILDGSQSVEAVTLNPLAWYAKNDIKLHAGVRAVQIKRFAKLVFGADGSVEPYDKLILATGSRPYIPPIEGLKLAEGSDKPGIFGFRSLEDCRRIAEYARGRRSAAVIGGGLLGLECAHALHALGIEAHVIHRSKHLMNQQLDSASGAILQSLLEKRGVHVHLTKNTTRVLGDERVTGLAFEDGPELECDVVVFASGTKPNTELAVHSGLSVGRAIMVNNQLRTDDPNIYAVGECIQYRAQVYGLVAPAWEQARVLAEHLTGSNLKAAYHGSKIATRLKVAGVQLTSMGLIEPGEDADEVVQFAEPRKGTYKKLIIRDGRLIGGILLGDAVRAAELLSAFDSSSALPAERTSLLFDIGAPAAGGLDQVPLDTQICSCSNIRLGTLLDCVKNGLRTPEAVMEATRAGKACSSCEPAVREIVGWACGESTTQALKELPGSDGEHRLQQKYGTTVQALAFYKHRMLTHLNPAMQAFIARQEMVFVATADRKGHAHSSFRAGHAGFVKVLDEKTIVYPEFRGNGVMSTLGNISENPYVGLTFIDFETDRIGLHVNGGALIVEKDELQELVKGHPAADSVLGDPVLAQLMSGDGGSVERWLMVSVVDAFVHCSKHIPRMQKMETEITWGTDDVHAKGGDYFGAATSKEGRIDAAAVPRLSNQFPSADWPTFGSTPLQTEVQRLLREAKIEPQHTHIESFLAIGATMADVAGVVTLTPKQRSTLGYSMLIAVTLFVVQALIGIKWPSPAWMQTTAASIITGLGLVLLFAMELKLGVVRWQDRKQELANTYRIHIWLGPVIFGMLLMHTSHFGFALSFWLTVCFLASLASGALLGVSADQKISDRFTKLLLGSHIVMSCIATGFAVAHGMMSVWFS
jgi:NADPH-dependent 2,4-dienoyl-CoA reductase/sulfur reductase-like enzyme/predicted pyridoxine 5'-phosphate oxidase superfamily flavin-nucleotide-binding protein